MSSARSPVMRVMLSTALPFQRMDISSGVSTTRTSVSASSPQALARMTAGPVRSEAVKTPSAMVPPSLHSSTGLSRGK